MEEKRNHKKSTKSVLGIALVLLAILLAILFYSNGTTTIVDGGTEVENQTFIACSSEKVAYPFFSVDGSKSKTLKINVMFDGDELETIMLTYILNYSNSSQAESSRDANHIAMNASFEENSLPPDYFDAHYSLMGNTMQLVLYARNNNLNGTSANYFLLGGVKGELKKDPITKALNDFGLDCAVRQ